MSGLDLQPIEARVEKFKGEQLGTAALDRIALLAEVKRLRIQLGCVKATAILWEEEADERERASCEADVSPGFAGSLYARALLGREHAAAIRDMLMETPEDDVVEAVILCGQSSGMFGVAECSRLDGHDSHHEDSSTGWTWRR